MDLWDTSKLVLFIAFFVPGFIAIKVHDLLTPTERRDASQTILEAVAYSCINYALLSWLLFIDIYYELSVAAPLWHALVLVVVLFMSPVLIAVAYYKIRRTKFLARYLPHPVGKAWDYVFGRQECYWVIIELTDGTRIGGMYDTESFASSFPAEEQIYIQQIWKLNGNGFVEPMDRSRGALIPGRNIKFIEFFV